MEDSRIRVACDFCTRDPITGKQYACLVCNDYYLCETCFSKKEFNLNHASYHPVQEIGVRPEEMYCCPYCAEKGFTGNGLIQHCRIFHAEGGYPVQCPVCLVAGALNNLLSTPLLEHLLERHVRFDAKGFQGLPLQARPQPFAQSENAACSICLENLPTGNAGTRYLQCTHGFHNNCITRWLRDHSNCPRCRTEVD